MGKPHSTDLRRRVLGAVEAGASATAAGRRFEVPASTAVRWVAIWRRERRDAALAMGGDRRPNRSRPAPPTSSTGSQNSLV